MTVEIYNHKSGVKVILDKNDSPVIGVNFSVNVGSINEGPEEKGISHFIEHVVFTGTKTKTKDEITSKLEQSGANLNAYTDFNETVYTVKCMKTNFDLCLETISDMITNCVFYKDQVENERSIILQEMSDGENDPMITAYDRYFEKFYKEEGMSTTIIGTDDILKKLSPEDLQRYYKKYYVPERMILSISGDIDKDNINKILDIHFDNESNVETIINDENFTPTDNKEISIPNDFSQDLIIWGFPLDKTNSIKDSLIIDMVNMYLGRGFSSILFKIIRDELGLVYNIGSTVYDVAGNDQLYIFTKCDSSKSEEIISILPKVIPNIKNISEDDLKSIKNRFRFEIAKSIEQKSNNASRNLTYFKCYNMVYSFEELSTFIDEITLDDCLVFINKFIQIEPIKFISKSSKK